MKSVKAVFPGHTLPMNTSPFLSCEGRRKGGERERGREGGEREGEGERERGREL